ncbi:Subtilisin-like protease [Vigna angularis]|uniref:Subtilisin-like protease n=1 Tax=Phaseolus angularis TaxID=3914 RepID=A0A8T0KP05_PHAAN|nr:Subtilisin-like protease [Vigna angularis]
MGKIPWKLLSCTFFVILFSLLFKVTADYHPSKTFIFRIDSESKPSVFPTHYHWYTSHFVHPTRLLHLYDTVFHGFSALLTPQQVSSLSQHPSVLAVFEDRRRHLHTTRSPQFVGLRNHRGLWSQTDYGSDVIIGVFDTGIWPERRSFSDSNLGPIPDRWKGGCDTGSYGAVSRGVFVSSSGGNDGPSGMSVTNLAPWLTTVAAGTIDRDFPAEVILGNGRRLSGVSLYSGVPLKGRMFPLIYPGKSGVLTDSLCMENSLDPDLVKGKIVVCDRGSNPRVAKGLEVKKAGGVGMILANGISNGEGLVGDAHLLPACALGANLGDEVKAYISSSENPRATIDFKGTVVGIKPAPVVASFSARGPNALNLEILKPDLAAPGVNILAAWTNAVGPSGLESDTRRSEFNILSGTSMACPHVSGAAALLKSAHPDWSPAAIRSAMMTTATVLDNTNRQMVDQATGNGSTPYDFGAGHLNLAHAIDPGLIFDITNDDYVMFLCAIGYRPRVIQVITRSPPKCPRRRPSPENLNYPSFVAVLPAYSSSRGLSLLRKTFFRTVTNVGEPNSVYWVRVEMQAEGVTVTVRPSRLVFSEAVKKRSFVVTVTGDAGNLVLGEAGAVFGSLSWTDGKHVVRSPMVVTQAQPF